MRIPALIVIAGFVFLGGVHAGEKPIPIEVEKCRFKVTDAHLDWIRGWLTKHLHPDDLEGIAVDIRNRTHPIADFQAEARLKARVSESHWVQRTIRLAHEDWPVLGKAKIEFTGGWHVREFHRVRRVFDVDTERKVMRLDDSMSYEETLEVLLIVHRSLVDFGEHVLRENQLPTLDRVWWIRREDDGLIRVRCGGHLRGTWFAGKVKGGKFIVEKRGLYMA